MHDLGAADGKFCTDNLASLSVEFLVAFRLADDAVASFRFRLLASKWDRLLFANKSIVFFAFLLFAVCNDFDCIDLFCDEMVVFELSAPKIASLFVIATVECCPTIDR